MFKQGIWLYDEYKKKPSRLGRFYLLIHADSKISRSHAELDPTSHQTSKNQDATLNRV
jgi:hypothetical protein